MRLGHKDVVETERVFHMGKMLGIGSFLIAAALATTALAADKSKVEKIPLQSTVSIVSQDVVDPAHPLGLIEFAFRTDMTVHYFKDDKNCGTYAADPKKYPDPSDVTQIRDVALYGEDVTVRYPAGIKDTQHGNVVSGHPAIASDYQGAKFLFVSLEHKQAFDAEPTKFVSAIGGYCTLAMSKGKIVPGDPRDDWYIQGIGWTIYGSPNGPTAMSKMTIAEQQKVYWSAVWNYQRLTGTNADAKVAQK